MIDADGRTWYDPDDHLRHLVVERDTALAERDTAAAQRDAALAEPAALRARIAGPDGGQ